MGVIDGPLFENLWLLYKFRGSELFNYQGFISYGTSNVKKKTIVLLAHSCTERHCFVLVRLNGVHTGKFV